MFNIRTELPSGAVSRGYDREDDDALSWFEKVKAQLAAMKFVGDLVLCEDGVELQRETFNAA